MPTRPTISTSSLPSISSLAARTPSLADLPDLPSPVYALVGAGDAALELALELPGKLATIDTTKLNPREVDVKSLELPRRKLDINVPKFDAAAVTATGIQWAAKAEEVYTSLVARGESVVAKARADRAEAEAQTPVAEPPAASTREARDAGDAGDSNGAGATSAAAKKATKKPSPKKATTDSSDAADL